MNSSGFNRIVRAGLCPALCLHLALLAGGCSSSSNISGSDAVAGLTSALTLASAAVGVASVASGRGYSGTSYQPASGTPSYRAPAGNGYSQKGAFDDCARLYGSAGMERQAQICRQNSANMQSLN